VCQNNLIKSYKRTKSIYDNNQTSYTSNIDSFHEVVVDMLDTREPAGGII